PEPLSSEAPPAESGESLKALVQSLRAEVEKKDQTAREAYDRYLRTLADFENYKKRAQKEKLEQAQFANEKLIKELLPVVDNLERALSHAKETNDFDKMVEGLELIYKQILSGLGKFGVTPIESLNRPFDPLLHQSIGQVESEEGSSAEEDRVVSETQKGYFLNDRVLRPSLVVVSKKKAPPQGDGMGHCM
ncbi:MAG TPA: nucleotide exchange factor GrpE, partial [Candidatus Manganitrophaceae bacterium]|nr:nucleotide exchange factor GrpE [Candidatus Manganitrophaceae bacterium]